MYRRLALLAAFSVIGACATVPPAVPAPRTATPVAASFGRTWDGVIDAFAARNIPIKTMDRASGFIATDALTASRADEAYADCGTAIGVTIAPGQATYNVVVRGDSAAATVRVTIRWVSVGSGDPCSSRGVWESTFENQVKEAAEGRKSGDR